MEGFSAFLVVFLGCSSKLKTCWNMCQAARHFFEWMIFLWISGDFFLFGFFQWPDLASEKTRALIDGPFLGG